MDEHLFLWESSCIKATVGDRNTKGNYSSDKIEWNIGYRGTETISMR